MSGLNTNNDKLTALMQQLQDLPPAAHADAVLRIPQEMTETQKWQARANIDAPDDLTVDPDTERLHLTCNGKPLGKGVELPSGKGGTSVGVLDALPEADEPLRGRLVIVPNGESDELFICMNVAGTYGWLKIEAVVNKTISELGVATLGTLVLGG